MAETIWKKASELKSGDVLIREDLDERDFDTVVRRVESTGGGLMVKVWWCSLDYYFFAGVDDLIEVLPPYNLMAQTLHG